MLTPKLAAVGPGTCGVRRTDHDWHPTSWTEATVLVPGEAKDDPTAPMQVRNAAGFTCARCLCYVDAAELYDDAPTMRDPAADPASLARRAARTGGDPGEQARARAVAVGSREGAARGGARAPRAGQGRVTAKILPFPRRVWKSDPLSRWTVVILAFGYLLVIAGLVVGAYMMRDSPGQSPAERRL